MKNKDNQFNVANLSDEEVKHLTAIEKSISDDKGEEIVLVAYKGHDKQ